jgi:hypothetical protein
METWRYGDMVTWRHGDMETSNGIRKREAQAIFLNSFTIYSACKWKFIVCPFVDKVTNGSYPFANGLNGLAHLCKLPRTKRAAFARVV